MIITFVLCYELISMFTEKNNMHEVDTCLLYTSCVGTAIFGVDEKMAAPENSAIIFSQNSLRKIRKKQDNVWVALMENILLVSVSYTHLYAISEGVTQILKKSLFVP